MDELKPCPFCGGSAELIGTAIFAPDYALSVRCTDCKVGTSHYVYSNTNGLWDAIENMQREWNNRAERTCYRDEYEAAPFSVCSECGAVLPDDCTVYYCWSCGAKVVE